MGRATLPRWILLLLLISFLHLGFSLASQPAPLTAQPEVEQLPPAFHAVQPDSPLTNPVIDARPLLDTRRQLMMDSTPAASQGDHSAVQPPTIHDHFAPIAENRPTALPANLTGVRGTPLGETRDIQAAGGESGCQYVLYNPSLDYGTGWYAYWHDVYISDIAYYTPPHSLRMVEDMDGDPASGDDYDGFGQPFIFPANTNSLSLDFKIAYSGWGTDDVVYWSFYYVDLDTGELLGLVPNAFGAITKYADNFWHAENIIINNSPVIQAMQGQPVALIFQIATDGDFTFIMDAYVDDVLLKLCAANTTPTGSISGTVSQTGSADSLSDAQLLLTYTPAGGELEVIDVAFPAANGAYTFSNVAPLAAGDKYQVWYLNDGSRSDRLAAWAARQITSLANGEAVTGVNFDIKNLSLSSPAHEAETTFPVTFTWASRGVTGDRYYLCIYDSQTLAEVCTTEALTSTSVTVNAADLQGIPSFPFEYGRRYGWYLVVVSADYNESVFAHLGYSYWAHAITFVTSTSPPPDNPPPPSGPPPDGNTGANWTVMFYIAGDNNLGDPVRYPNPTFNLQGQFALLKQLAVNYPQINLVTLTDFYDNSGTQFCHLRPDGIQDCQQLGEKDTSNPATLTDFINSALQRFPAPRTMLIISDHGHTIAGVASDETTNPTAVMAPNQIRQALQNASLHTRKLDILFYNVCLMGSLEAAFDATPYADYMVASANEVWVLSVYERLLPLLANQANTPRAVATGIVNAYQQTINAAVPGYFISSAAYDLSRVAAVNSALSALGTAMANNLAVSRDAINSIRNQVQVYDSSGNLLLGSEDAFVDLRHLATRLRDASNNPAISSAANDLLTALGPVGGGSSLVIASQQVSGANGQGGTNNLSNASGLSIFFPNGLNTGGQPTLNNSYLNGGIYQNYVNQTQWDEFVRAYVNGVLSSGPNIVESGTPPISGAVPVAAAPVFLPMLKR